jgi:hypothetical protein
MSSSKNTTANGTKAMTHALITEIQLGRTIKEVADALCDELDFSQHADIPESMDEVISGLIQLNKPHVRFHILSGQSSHAVAILDKSWSRDLYWDYWDDDHGYARDDEAYDDCQKLNTVIERLFGIEHKAKKPKTSQKEYVNKKGKVCPYCGSKNLYELDRFVTYRTRRRMVCKSCEHEWEEHYKMVLTKFKGEK